MPKKKSAADELLLELRQFGLSLPGAHTKSPWPGHLDLAVNDKIFAHLSIEGEPFKISCKLPDSNALALSLPFAEPTRYGLGKSGWVTAHAVEGEPLPREMFKAWIEESYRALAPKRLVAQLAGGGGAQPSDKQASATQAAATKKLSTKRMPAKKAPAEKAPTMRAPAVKAPARTKSESTTAVKKKASGKPRAR